MGIGCAKTNSQQRAERVTFPLSDQSNESGAIDGGKEVVLSRSLNMGQFFGDIAERWAVDSVVVNRLVHHKPRALPSHAHQAGFVSLMLEGEYRETAGFTQLGYHPFSCVYHPPGMDHRDEVGQAGVTLLTLEFKPELFGAMDFAAVNLRPIIDLSGAQPAWDLMDLYRRIVARQGNQLDLESRAVALAFSIVRSSARVPRDLQSLRRACEYVHAHFGSNLTLAQVARAAGVHPVYLGQAFRQEFGETLGEYLNRIRVRAAAECLANSDLPLSTIALDLGFYDQSHFTRIFRQLTGATPGMFRADYATHKLLPSATQ
jgi:AraC family transcriptional regulator